MNRRIKKKRKRMDRKDRKRGRMGGADFDKRLKGIEQNRVTDGSIWRGYGKM